MKIAVEGCMHGELTKIYDTIAQIEKSEGYKIDLLLCCGDFQATRNFTDLKCMAVPDKYKDMGSFYQYYSGEKKAPVLTIFVGGNHEASNYLQELPYGGWVAPNIYYMGYAGVVKFNGVRIAGMSGIYKGMDYLKGHYEYPPYDNSTMRSVYHVRNIETFRLRQLTNSPDIMLSHDWPRGIYKHGNVDALLRQKRHFREEVEQDKLGSRPAMEVLEALKPNYWFAAHLHVKFAAVVDHKEGKLTKFLSLDKCLPNRKFLQILEVGPEVTSGCKLSYDPEWLAILRSTNNLLSVERRDVHMPGPRYPGRWDFRPSADEVEEVVQIFGGNLEIPENFQKTVEPYNPAVHHKKMMWTFANPTPNSNAQTEWLCSKLDLDDPIELITSKRNAGDSQSSNLLKASDFSSTDVTLTSGEATAVSFNQDEIVLDDDEDDGESCCQKEDSKPAESASLAAGRTVLHLPSPKRKLDNEEESADTAVPSGAKAVIMDDALFVIDRGDGATEVVTDPKPESDPPAAKKTLRRRNQALYDNEENI